MLIPSEVIFVDKQYYQGFKYPIYALDGIGLRVIRRRGWMVDIKFLGQRPKNVIDEFGAIIGQQNLWGPPPIKNKLF